MKHNKTYKNKNTKHNEKTHHLILGIILALFFMLTFIDALSNNININIINQAPKQTTSPVIASTTLSINNLTVISVNSTNEQIAWLACFQAVDKHLPLTKYTKEQRLSAVYDLISIAHQENRDFNYKSIGADSYSSFGLFQISLHYHKNITIDQALDPFFSADWTLRRLINKGYLSGNRSNSIMSHNGTPNIKQTLTYLQGVNNYKQTLINK